MKTLKIAVLLVAGLTVLVKPARAGDPYFHVYGTASYPLSQPLLSAGEGFNSKFNAVSAETMFAPVYAPKGIPMPKSLADLGMQPIAYGLNIGAGACTGSNTSQGTGSVCVPGGIWANLTPALLGPAVKALNGSKSTVAKDVGAIIAGQSGGLAFGPQWMAYPVIDGVVQPFDKWRGSPGWFAGAMYKVGGAASNGTAMLPGSVPDIAMIHGDLHGKLSLL